MRAEWLCWSWCIPPPETPCQELSNGKLMTFWFTCCARALILCNALSGLLWGGGSFWRILFKLSLLRRLALEPRAHSVDCIDDQIGAGSV